VSAKPNLKALMNHGPWGNSLVTGLPPIHVELALRHVFDCVLNERFPGAWNRYEFEFQCYDANGALRLKVQYGWNYNGWVYRPVAVSKNTKLTAPGGVIYQPDGGYRIAA